jgi:hypothetical protein
MLAFTVRPADDGSVTIERGLRLDGGGFHLSSLLPTADLTATHGPNALVERVTPYRRLDPLVETVDIGPEVLPDVRALLFMDGRQTSDGVFFSFVYTSDVGAGVQRLLLINTREDDGPAQMSELVVLQPGAGVPILLGRRGAHAIVRYDGVSLRVESVPPTTTHVARPSDVLVPV